jgi:hypothetical protein
VSSATRSSRAGGVIALSPLSTQPVDKSVDEPARRAHFCGVFRVSDAVGQILIA